MICYKDRSYCWASNVNCFNDKCPRFLSEEENERANSLDLPISFANFSEGCTEVVKEPVDEIAQ